MTLPGHAGLDLVAAPHNAGLHQVEFHRLDTPINLSTCVDRGLDLALSMAIGQQNQLDR